MEPAAGWLSNLLPVVLRIAATPDAKPSVTIH